jgi:hypothetical protein
VSGFSSGLGVSSGGPACEIDLSASRYISKDVSAASSGKRLRFGTGFVSSS